MVLPDAVIATLNGRDEPYGTPRALLEARWEALARALDDAGLDALVIAGRDSVIDYGDVCFATGFPPLGSCAQAYAVVPRPGDPPELVVADRDHDAARAFGAGDLIASGSAGPRLAEHLVRTLNRLPRGATVGTVGFGRRVGRDDWRLLEGLEPRIGLEPADAVLARVKMVKSKAELALQREAVAIADAGFERLLDRVAAGVTEREVAAEAERVVRARGALTAIVFVIGGRMFPRPATDRTLVPGSLVGCCVEIAAPSGYWVEKGVTCALGSPPEAALAVHAASERAFAAAEALLTPGTPAEAVAASIERTAAHDRYVCGIAAGHGSGVGEDAPRLVPGDATALAAGTVVSLHPHVCDARHGALAIDQYEVTDGAPRRQSAFSRELRWC